jgi:hypothetical protein
MPIPQQLTFEGTIDIINWLTHARITTVEAIAAYLIMGRSGHFSGHTGPAIRSLSEQDATALHIDPNTPVYFQMGVEGRPLYRDLPDRRR